MTQRSNTYLKGISETGDQANQTLFEDLIDTFTPFESGSLGTFDPSSSITFNTSGEYSDHTMSGNETWNFDGLVNGKTRWVKVTTDGSHTLTIGTNGELYSGSAGQLPSGTYKIGLAVVFGAVQVSIPGTGSSDTNPVASNVILTGSMIVGNLLSGSYTYYDADGDTEDTTVSGSEYELKSYASSALADADTDNSSGTSLDSGDTGGSPITDFYTIVVGDVGNYFKLWIRVKNANGQSSWVSSSTSAQVAAAGASWVELTDLDPDVVFNVSFFEYDTDRWRKLATSSSSSDANRVILNKAFVAGQIFVEQIQTPPTGNSTAIELTVSGVINHSVQKSQYIGPSGTVAISPDNRGIAIDDATSPLTANHADVFDSGVEPPDYGDITVLHSDDGNPDGTQYIAKIFNGTLNNELRIWYKIDQWA